jgi:glycosyltransferase involved in cell wall biosynthesis
MSRDSDIVVSVCVVTYNHVNYIKECLDGILMQKTTFPFEIILGEDESDDGTREICIDYANRFPDTIKLFLRSREDVIYINGNATGRFNMIENLKAAKGKYIALCEGDDYWTDPLKLQKQVDFLENNEEFSLVFHNVNILDDKNAENHKFPMHKNLQKDVFITEDILKQWFIPTGSIVMKNDNNFQFPDWFYNAISGDVPLLLIWSLKGKFKYLNNLMGVYRKHDQGISNTHFGYLKAFGMIYIYHNFDKLSNYKFTNKIKEAMIYEMNTHYPELIDFKKTKRELKNIKSDFFIKRYLNTKKMIKKIF